MNKKILALAMVPLLIGLSGAVAFSQFTGSDNKVINATAGTLQFTESAEITSVAIDPSSMLYVAGPSYVYGAGYTPFGGAMDLGSMVSSSGSNTMTYTINAGRLTPGDWFSVQFTLANTGSVPFLASVSGSGATVSVRPNSLSALPASISNFPTGSDALGSTWLYLDNTASVFPGSGLFMPTSGASSVVTFNVYIGLGNSADNTYQSSTFTDSLTITFTTT